MSEEIIIKEIEENTEEYITFLQELIQTNSYNPPGNENSVAVKIKEYLEKDGIKCDVYPFGDNRANAIAYLNENFDYKNLLFNAHMDVVPPGEESEWKNPPLSANIKRKKMLFGRGATDMKGGLAAMVIALKILKKLNLSLKGNLILNAVADEEMGGILGTKWCLENKLNSFKFDFTVVGEPTGINPLPKAVVVGERGHLILKVIANGISAHSSMPSLGKNAIYMMSELMQALDKVNNYIPDLKPPLSLEKLKSLMSKAFPSREIFENILSDQELLQNLLQSLVTFTKSVNMIKGGIKENVVPDKCEVLIDFRLLPGQKVEDIFHGMRTLIEKDLHYKVVELEEVKPNEPSFTLESAGESEGSYWRDWENSPILKDFMKITEEIYMKTPFILLYPAAADAHYLRNDGYCPSTILFGPGSAGTAHAIDEYIEIKDFIDSIKVYALFAFKFLK